MKEYPVQYVDIPRGERIAYRKAGKGEKKGAAGARQYEQRRALADDDGAVGN